MPYEQQIWCCRYCHVWFAELEEAASHEQECYDCPSNRGCPTCKFWPTVSYELWICEKGLTPLKLHCHMWEKKDE